MEILDVASDLLRCMKTVSLVTNILWSMKKYFQFYLFLFVFHL